MINLLIKQKKISKPAWPCGKMSLSAKPNKLMTGYTTFGSIKYNKAFVIPGSEPSSFVFAELF